MKTGRYNIKELLTHNEIEQIIIPEIQRDYVWQEENVVKLVSSILDRFKTKSKNKLTIQVEGVQIENNSISDFLQHEYDRLIHNLKIGFIYAYHDNEYAGKFFLIDGQQRMTSLYLLLLNLYKKAGKQQDFQNLYFSKNQLKIDYKVREASHDFLVDFVINELNNTSLNIKDSKDYYSEYDNDITIQNIIINYKCIDKLLHAGLDCNELIRFVEDFVEVNYFDTHLSQQGEQLYLYMNSRGESLSYQEIIKSEIISKIGKEDVERKKEAGKRWEDWQNFFWQFKGENENADIGFKEFLKWASMIQICTTHENDNLVERLDLPKKGKQSLLEAKENYIHRIEPRFQDQIRDQNKILENYQIQASNFEYQYLETIYKALKDLFSMESNYIPLPQTWLSNKLITIDYVVLCPLIYFIANSDWLNEDEKKRDVERLAMFLKNLTFFTSNLGKNPDNATIRSLELVKELCKAKQTDICYFLDESFGKQYNQILTEAERFKLRLFKTLDNTPNAELSRTDLELKIWKLTLLNGLPQFMEGDISILFDCVYNEFIISKGDYIKTNKQLDAFNNYLKVLTNVILKYHDQNYLRKALLTFGDYLLHDNGGSWHFGMKIERYSFIQNAAEWRMIFKEKKDEVILDFMTYMKDFIDGEVKQVLLDLCNTYKADNCFDWKEPFIKCPDLLTYCTNKKILWHDLHRILLLGKHQANTACEIQTKLLSLKFEKSWIYQHNVCVLDFDIENESWVHAPDQYALDLTYENNEWRFSLLYRNEELEKQKLKIFQSSEEWSLIGSDPLRAVKVNWIYTNNASKSILENVEAAYLEVLKLKEEVRTILVGVPIPVVAN